MVFVQERERLFTKFGPFNMIDDDTSFVLKNLALYNEEQCRRLTGNVVNIDQLDVPSKDDISISFPLEDKKQKRNTNNSAVDQFFHNSDLTSMTPESQSILDDMFSA
jgi:hypothetical protein